LGARAAVCAAFARAGAGVPGMAVEVTVYVKCKGVDFGAALMNQESTVKPMRLISGPQRSSSA
jgi:hypothetical protein